MIDPAHKEWIDRANYTELLSRWRFASSGDSAFEGETGEYYIEVMKRRREEVGPEGAVLASKTVGWETR